MSISTISSSQPRQDLFSLASALNSGNVNAAQTALATFQQDLASFQTATGTSGLPANLNADLQQLQSDLSSNNLTNAKTDFDNFLQDLQAKRQIHHHHHHHHGTGSQNGSQNTTNPLTGSLSTTGTTINITA